MTMWKDPIVEEVRRAREAYAAEFGHDVDAIFADLARKDEEARAKGWIVVEPPARAEPRASSAA
ncbi:MAG TPA: hypothetical protein VFE05_23875 [Longimicrobiaceae bacterium]|jgi:hypothetical protein|nr:hypothetical protein [Longimicrobiaceae bacterium]